MKKQKQTSQKQRNKWAKICKDRDDGMTANAKDGYHDKWGIWKKHSRRS